MCSPRIPPSPRRPWCPRRTRNGAKSRAPSSSPPMERSRRLKSCMQSYTPFAAPASPPTRCRGASNLSPTSLGRRQGRSENTSSSRHRVRRGRWVFGERDEFLIVEIGQLHPPGPPVGLVLLDAVPGGRDEVPFDEARTNRPAAAQHDLGGA